MKLRPNERCPIHRGSKTCCGRAQERPRAERPVPKYRLISLGTKLYPDGHIERTPAALRARKDSLLRQCCPCAACGQLFTEYSQVELAHRLAKGMNGWKRDDSDSNTTLMHFLANRMQCSLDLDVYLKEYWRPEHCKS
jgi:hypothetical protein